MRIVKVYGLDGFFGKCQLRENWILLNVDNTPRENFSTLIHELIHLLVYKTLGNYGAFFHNLVDQIDEKIRRVRAE